jgi:hypothetical protein
VPILASSPVVNRPVDTRFNDSRRLEFRSLSGDVLQWVGPSWVALEGLEGLHMPPREVVRDQMPGVTGSLLREVRELERVVSLPVFIESDAGHADHLAQLARLQAFFDGAGVDYAAEGGTFDLVAVSSKGERALRCVYLEGMEGSEGGIGSGASWASFGLRLLAVDPYWHGTAWSTGTLRIPSAVGWMSASNGSYTTTWPGRLTASLAISNSMSVKVGGDAPSCPTIEVVGPADGFRATTTRGLNVSLVGGLAAGETMLVTTDPRQRDVTFNGVRDWSRVAPGDLWEPLLPGTASVSLTMAGATDVSSARLFGESLHKRAW